MSAIKYQKDQDNIVTLTLDSSGQSANTMNAEFRDSLKEVATQLKAESQDGLAGVIITSAKKTFFAVLSGISCSGLISSIFLQ